MKPWLLIASWLLFASVSQAQEAVERLLEEVQDETEVELLAELLSERLTCPLDINTATEAELLELPYFDSYFVRNLLLERTRRGGRFRSIYELKTIQGAPVSKFTLLEPFLTLSEEQAELSLEQSLFVGTEGQLPLRRDKYQGIGWGVRYAGARGNRHSWSIVAGRDRGEPRRVDYLSASYRYQGTVLEILAGDYRVSAGLGLHLGQSLSYFSRAEVSGRAPQVSARVLRPHSSFRESGFLRGLGVGVKLDNLRATFLVGRELIDARVEGGRVMTLYPGGMHRTSAEIKHRHTAQRPLLGAVLSYHIGHLELGWSGVRQHYLSPNRTELLPPTKQTHLSTSSLYFQYLRGAWQVSGETLLTNAEYRSSLLSIGYRHPLYGRFALVGRQVGVAHFAPQGYSDTNGVRGLQAMWSGELAYWWRGMLFLDLSNKGWSTTARAEYRYRKSAMQGWLRLTQGRVSARLAYQYHATRDALLRTGAHLSHTEGAPLTWGIFVRGQWQLSRALRTECGMQYFHAPAGAIRANQPYMPWRYYAPMLRGNGIRVSAHVRYAVAKAQFHLRTAHALYTKEPTAPLPSLLELSTIIKL